MILPVGAADRDPSTLFIWHAATGPIAWIGQDLTRVWQIQRDNAGNPARSQDTAQLVKETNQPTQPALPLSFLSTRHGWARQLLATVLPLGRFPDQAYPLGQAPPDLRIILRN